MRISTLIAVFFTLALVAIAGASATVASIESGAERILAVLISATAFAFVVLGRITPGDWVSPVRRFLAWVSSTRTRVFVSTAAMAAISVAALLLGPACIYHEAIACADAKSVMFPKPLGERTESCSTDSRATFTAWQPFGREYLRRSLVCNYPTGSQASLIVTKN